MDFENENSVVNKIFFVDVLLMYYDLKDFILNDVVLMFKNYFLRLEIL